MQPALFCFSVGYFILHYVFQHLQNYVSSSYHRFDKLCMKKYYYNILSPLWLDFSNKLFLEKRKISSELTWLCLYIFCQGFVGRLSLSFFPKLVSIQKNTKYCSRFLHFTYRISLYGIFLHATLNPFGFFIFLFLFMTSCTVHISFFVNVYFSRKFE